jgi:HPr kinase/phosphorylase
MAEKKYSVSLKEIIDHFELEALYLPMDGSKLFIHQTDINRPGLQIMGFYEYFSPDRIQVLWKT